MDFYEFLVQPYQSYQPYQIILEAVAVIFGLMSVFFSIKKNIWVYPTGIISTSIFVYILLVFGLLGDMLINFYYTIMSIYGWLLWSRNTSEDSLHVSVGKANKKDWQISTLLFVLSLGLVTLVYLFKPIIENPLSESKMVLKFRHLDWANWLDIFTTSLFLVGMWLMAKRKIENWIFWIIADLISVPMYFYKGLGITAFQYSVFTILAWIGYIQWKKNIKTS